MTHRPRLKKWLFALLKLVVLGLLVWFLRSTLQTGFDQLRGHKWEVHLPWLVFAGFCYVLGLMPVAVFWHRVLLATGQQVGLFETVRAWWLSQIAKYVPGKAMVLVVRTGMLRSPNVETTVVAASVFVETLTMMAAGSLLSFVIVVTVHWHELLDLLRTVHSWNDLVRISSNHTLITAVAALGMFVGTALPTWPPMMKFIAKILGVGKLNPSAADKLGRVPYRVLAMGWLTIGCGWLLQGLGLWATLRSLGVDVPISKLPMNTAVVAMSAVAGFLSFIPGGAGVREVVQTELMVGDYGQGPALVAAIILRLVMVVAELIVSTILYPLGPHRFRHKLGGHKDPPTKSAAEG